MTFVRPVGTILPGAVATMSTVPRYDQASAQQNSRMIVAPIARPIGDGGVSTTSRAAGRKANSSARLAAGAAANGPPESLASALDDFMNARLHPVQAGVPAACTDQIVM